MMFVGTTEAGLKFCGGNNYKLFLGLTINNCGVRTLSDRWLGGMAGVFLKSWSQEGIIRLSNLEGYVVLE